MKNALLLPFVAGILCASMIAPAGCARSPSARFYTLNSLTDAGSEKRGPSVDCGVAIGLGPIRFPEYLDRPQIVTRVSPNEVEFAEFHRWAESLKDHFASTLALNLSILLDTSRVAVYPWTSTTPVDYQVKIDVIRFDGRPGQSVVLQAPWAIFGKDPTKALSTGDTKVKESVDAQGYEALVSAQSRALAALSREIAEAIGAVRKP